MNEVRRDTDWNILRRYTAAAYLTGFAINVVMYFSMPVVRDNPRVIPLAFAELALGLTLALYRNMPGWAVRMLGISGAIVVISTAVTIIRPVGPTPIWYVLPAIAIARFCSLRETLANFVVLSVSFAVALQYADRPQEPTVTYGVVLVVVTLLISAHRRQVGFTGTVMAQLEIAAATDLMTGLLNRGAASVAFVREVELAQEAGLPLSVVLFDLDHFKTINDTLGHDAGDKALCHFANVLNDERSPADIVARMGGEEFLAVLVDTDQESAASFARRVSERLSDDVARRGRHAFTTSAGIASLSGDLATPADLLTAADRALYSAKRAGRNRSVVADSSRPLAVSRVA